MKHFILATVVVITVLTSLTADAGYYDRGKYHGYIKLHQGQIEYAASLEDRCGNLSYNKGHLSRADSVSVTGNISEAIMLRRGEFVSDSVDLNDFYSYRSDIAKAISCAVNTQWDSHIAYYEELATWIDTEIKRRQTARDDAEAQKAQAAQDAWDNLGPVAKCEAYRARKQKHLRQANFELERIAKDPDYSYKGERNAAWNMNMANSLTFKIEQTCN